MIPIIEKQHKNTVKKSGLKSILLDLRIRYLFGGSMEFVEENSIRMEEDEVLFKMVQSHTNFFNILIGVSFGF